MEEIKKTLTYTALLDTLSETIVDNGSDGVLLGYTLVLPNFTTAVSAILTIKDRDGYTVYTGDAKNENVTSTVINMSGLCPFGRSYVATVTLNAAAGGTHVAVLKLYVAPR